MTVPEGWLKGGGTTETTGSPPSRVQETWRHLFDDYEAVLALLTHSPTAKLSPPFNVQPIQTPIPSMPPSTQISM